MNRYLAIASGATLILLAACSTLLVEPYPNTWPKIRAARSCEDINGSYETIGIRGDGSLANRPRMDYWIFRVGSNLVIPARVDLKYVPETSKVEATLISESGTLIDTVAAAAKCDHSQVTIYRSGRVRGEGTSGTVSSTVRLMRATDGSLIVASHVQSEQLDFLIFPYSRDEQSWQLFDEAGHGAKP